MKMFRIPLSKLQRALNENFPGIVLRADDDIGADNNSYDVFCVPDAEMSKFIQFCMDILPDWLEQNEYEQVSLIPHSQSATKKHYPDIADRHSISDGTLLGIDYSAQTKISSRAAAIIPGAEFIWAGISSVHGSTQPMQSISWEMKPTLAIDAPVLSALKSHSFDLCVGNVFQIDAVGAHLVVNTSDVQYQTKPALRDNPCSVFNVWLHLDNKRRFDLEISDRLKEKASPEVVVESQQATTDIAA